MVAYWEKSVRILSTITVGGGNSYGIFGSYVIHYQKLNNIGRGGIVIVVEFFI